MMKTEKKPSIKWATGVKELHPDIFDTRLMSLTEIEIEELTKLIKKEKRLIKVGLATGMYKRHKIRLKSGQINTMEFWEILEQRLKNLLQ